MNELSVTSFKRCSKCKCLKPSTTESFRKDSRRKDGLRGCCKTCSGALDRAYYEVNKDDVLTRGRKYYAANSSAINARTLEWKTNNPEKVAEIRKKWKTNNPEKVAEYKKNWNTSNPERRAEYQKKWYERNPEKRAEHRKNFNASNPEKLKAYRATRRARKKSAEGCFSGEDVARMYDDQQGLCAYCENPLFGDYHVDHMVPLSRGGTNDWTNLAVTCPLCNMRKNTKTAEEFMRLLRC